MRKTRWYEDEAATLGQVPPALQVLPRPVTHDDVNARPSAESAPSTPSAPSGRSDGSAESAAAVAPPRGLDVRYTQTRVDPSIAGRLQRLPGVVRDDRSELSETFRRLRSQVLRRMRGEQQRLLAITSARSCQGKSLTALNLALAIAAEPDASVLLIDGELGGDGLQRLLGLAGRPGLGEHLETGDTLSSLLVNPGVSRCVLLPAGCRGAARSAELLGASAARALMLEARARYAERWVIVDLPPLLERADALAFLPVADTSLLVVERERHTVDDIEAASALLAPFNLVGAVMSAPAPAPSLQPGRRGWRWWRGGPPQQPSS